ncbi:hypothetical protein SAMN02745227_00535 [Anaerobranca californiensis DSM 14826]|jgi:hypothetical protein|uniref:Uncharacterized protein n=1 Tax=Anaerobranca californiensis DSM 14826 TaxID=1120989 RepID=A0A1M6LJQ5_9FIRM|nr:hypothetical protein [Anaerobranca californiensis]SHJ71380.1 hypothetical protein SAMN02745227_00535 [Anaerobranca californiensis DSM 14826]
MVNSCLITGFINDLNNVKYFSPSFITTIIKFYIANSYNEGIINYFLDLSKINSFYDKASILELKKIYIFINIIDIGDQNKVFSDDTLKKVLLISDSIPSLEIINKCKRNKVQLSIFNIVTCKTFTIFY